MKFSSMFSVAVALSLAAAPAWCAFPSRYTFESSEDLDKGELNNVSLSTDGALSLAPRLSVLAGPAQTGERQDDVFVWSLLAAPDGQLFAGTGNGGALLTGRPETGLTVLGRTGDLIVTALARDGRGTVYAAGMPSGKIYKVNGDKLEAYAQVPAPYVWALVAHPDGRLFAATGPDGVLYAIGADRAVTPFWKSTEKNLTALALHPDGSLVVGTEPSGQVVKITPEGKASMLFDAPQNEIRALAIDRAGRIYAAATSAQRGALSASGGQGGGGGAAPAGAAGGEAPKRMATETPAPAKETPAPAKDGAAPQEASAGSSRSASPTKFGRRGVDQNQAVYRIGTDGVATPVLSAGQAVLLSLALDEKERLWVGTGNQGVLFRLEGNQVVKLVRTETSQVMALAPLAGGAMAFATGTPARVMVAGAGLAASGSWLSEAHDFGGPSRFGVLGFRQLATAAGSVRVSTRSGNSAKPDETWSAWSAPITRETGAAVTSPAARFLQVKVELSTTDGATSPRVTGVWVVSQQANAAPEVDKLTVGMPAVDVVSDPRDLDTREATKEKRKKRESPSIRHLKWEGSDPNEDRLSYRLAIKGEGESTWRDLSQRDLTANTLDWDTADLPDGYYRLRVTVSDALSNPDGADLTGEVISEPILVDNTPPRVDLQVTTAADGTADVSGTVSDGPANVLSVEVAVDDGDYRVCGVTDGLADSPREMYRVKLASLSPGEHSISVRAYDELGNAGTARRTVTVPKR